MSAVREIAVAILLVTGVGLQLLACLGLLAMRDTFARLHYVGLAGFGVAAIAVAILVEESFSIVADKGLATAAVVLATGPILVHTTARSARIRRRGEWTIGQGEDVERVGR